jgi:GT2 family glycosyltransferase
MTIIVAVVNKIDLFSSTILENRFMNPHAIHRYDNRESNIGISRRYNDFIDHHMPDDAWVVFCHQDFGFEEEIEPKLARLDKNVIYGPIGTGPTKQLVFIASLSRYGFERLRIGFYDRWKKFGRIMQKTARKTVRMGQFIRKPVVVDTLDSCCMIVHSSLIRKHNLRFDERLDWHLYVEDFSLNAKRNGNIATKAVQFKCFHLSGGTIDFTFHENLIYLKKKYGTERFATTCYDGYTRF